MVSPKKQTKRTVSRGYYSTPAWRALALACKARDGERCRRCGKGRTKRRRLHAHHVIPRSKGGADHLDNLITLCATCHSEEHPRMRRKGRVRARSV